MIWGPTRAEKTDFSHFLTETLCKRIKTTIGFDYMQKRQSCWQKNRSAKSVGKKIEYFSNLHAKQTFPIILDQQKLECDFDCQAITKKTVLSSVYKHNFRGTITFLEPDLQKPYIRSLLYGFLKRPKFNALQKPCCKKRYRLL